MHPSPPPRLQKILDARAAAALARSVVDVQIVLAAMAISHSDHAARRPLVLGVGRAIRDLVALAECAWPSCRPTPSPRTRPRATVSICTLSHRGVAQLTQIGIELRASLVDRGGLLPPRYAASALAVRAPASRARCRARRRCSHPGLYPPESRDSGSKIDIDVSLSDAMIPEPVPRRSRPPGALERAVLASESCAPTATPTSRCGSRSRRSCGRCSPTAPAHSFRVRDHAKRTRRAMSLCRGTNSPRSVSAWTRTEAAARHLRRRRRRAAGIGAFRWRALGTEPELAALAMGEMGAADARPRRPHAPRRRRWRAAAAGVDAAGAAAVGARFDPLRPARLLPRRTRCAGKVAGVRRAASGRCAAEQERAASETGAAALQPGGSGRPPRRCGAR